MEGSHLYQVLWQRPLATCALQLDSNIKLQYRDLLLQCQWSLLYIAHIALTPMIGSPVPLFVPIYKKKKSRWSLWIIHGGNAMRQYLFSGLDYRTHINFLQKFYFTCTLYIIGGCRLPHHMVYTDRGTSMLLMITVPSLVSWNEAILYNTTHTKLKEWPK